MNRKILSFAVVFFLALTMAGLAQEPSAAPPPTPVPAASRTDVDCSGFIAGTKVSRDVYIVDGLDDDFHSPVRQYATGDLIFLVSRSGVNFAAGTEYSLVRPAKEVFRESWYVGQHGSVRSLGTPYEDVGRVKITRLAPEAAIAEVTFACGAIYPGDLAVPYQARAIPEYVPAKEFDRFSPPSGNRMGAITAASGNGGLLATGGMAFVNLGESDGVKPGQRYRIFRIVRDNVEGLYSFGSTPREALGEMIILSTQERSSVGIVVNCTREISLGDGIELE